MGSWIKGPKGPHSVHLNTMCHFFDRSVRAAILFFLTALKRKLGRGRWHLTSCQVSLNSVQKFMRKYRKCLSESEASVTILIFDLPKNHKLGRGCWDLLFKISWILFRGLRGNVENVSANQRPGGGGGGGPIGPKDTNLVEDVEILLPVKFCWMPFSDFRGEENVSANQRPGRPSCFPTDPKNTNLEEDTEILSIFVEFPSAVSEEKSNIFSQSEARPAILFFQSARKKPINLVEDIEILLPFRFRWIPFSGFRGEVENVSANQRPGR